MFDHTTAEMDYPPLLSESKFPSKVFTVNVFHRCRCARSLSWPTNVKWFGSSLGTRFGIQYILQMTGKQREDLLQPRQDLLFHNTLVWLSRTSQLRSAAHTQQLWRAAVFTPLTWRDTCSKHSLPATWRTFATYCLGCRGPLFKSNKLKCHISFKHLC